MNNILLDDEKLKEVVMTAIMKEIDTKSRDAIIQSAVEHLLKDIEQPNPNGYGTVTTSHLQTAFNRAVEQFGNSFVKELIDNTPEYKLRIQKLLVVAVDKAMTRLEKDGDSISDKVASKIASAFTSSY